MKRLSIILCALFLVFSMAGVAGADLIQYSDRALFEAQGSIVFNYGYEDFEDDDYSYPPSGWTSHGVTYTAGENLIVGTETDYEPISNVFTDNGWKTVLATIQPSSSFSMFGLDLSYLGSYSRSLTFEVFTTEATYRYSGIGVPNASSEMDFYGFISDPGEYFTGFRISSPAYITAPAIDNVTLGNTTPENTSPVPEPATMLLLGAGLVGLAGFGRKKILKK